MKKKVIVMQHFCIKHASPNYPEYKRECLESFVTTMLEQNACECALICINRIS